MVPKDSAELTHPAGFKDYLDGLVARFERPDFIACDPISVPHAFEDPRDQEVIGLYAALLAWGRRDLLLRKLADLCERMRYRPYAFVYHFDEVRDGARLAGFKHRTFQPEDALWLTKCLQAVLHRYGRLEALFARGAGAPDVGPAIEVFSRTLLSALPDVPPRLGKHLARPSRGSACKRLSMYLRWMVRPGPVDLGLWTAFTPARLVLPLDVHSGRQARALGLLSRRADDWTAVQRLTEQCRLLAHEDPCRYDYAFFGLGVTKTPIDPRFLAASPP